MALDGLFATGTGFALGGKTDLEGSEMEATIREARMAAGAGNLTQHEEMITSARYVANNLLSELPGIAFGLITLVYIISTLIALR